MILINLLFVLLSPLIESEVSEVLEDKIYDPYIKTVQIYPRQNSPGERLIYPVISIQQQTPIAVEFDDINEAFVNYSFRIIHCDEDWTRSQMRENEYLFEFNVFPVEDYGFSIDTRVPYVHYRFLVPPVKLPGNYAVEVFPTDDETKTLFRKRFLVFEGKVQISSERSLTQGLIEFAQRNQQINFTLSYDGYPMVNPAERTFVKILQNHRWDTSIDNLKPTFVREDLSNLEYVHFSDKNQFRGGNEFRFFDLRSVRYPGQNVDYARLHSDHVTAQLFPDKPRTGTAYAIGLQQDYNGQYIVSNQDRRNPDIESEYVDVSFQLESEQLDGQVHINGALTNWQLDEDSKMEFNASIGTYSKTLLLKQGWYDYKYEVESSALSASYLEGDHFETENIYEILVYYRPMDLRADLLVGYFVIRRN